MTAEPNHGHHTLLGASVVPHKGLDRLPFPESTGLCDDSLLSHGPGN